MNLGTFGAIISFALELEEQAFEFYKNQSKAVFSQSNEQFLKGSQKRLNRLRRIRQEMVTEMILEPITGVDSEEYTLRIADSSKNAEVLNQAIHIEENIHSFYTTTAPLIPMKEVQRAFLRLADENKTRLEKIRITLEENSR